MTAGPRTSFIVLLLTLLTSFPAVAGDYLNSAHGNTSYGVNRLGSPYVAGNCAHCHEQHASIDGNEPSPVTDGTPTKHALFTTAYTSATDNFCIECHDGTTRVANTAIINHSYSYRAGGLTTDFASSIKDIFDLDSLDIASTHNLDDIKTLLSSAAIGIPWGYSSTSHPCEGCHNPHAVQGDPANSDTGRKNRRKSRLSAIASQPAPSVVRMGCLGRRQHGKDVNLCRSRAIPGPLLRRFNIQP